MKNKSFFAVLLVCILIISSTSSVLAATKTKQDYHVFTASVPDFGSFVAWGVDFGITGVYSNPSTGQYTLTEISTYAMISPKRGDISNGQFIASINERIDYGSETRRTISPTRSSFWKTRSEVWPGNALIYFTGYGNPNRAFSYEVEETGYYTFSVPGGIVHNPNHSMTLYIGGPK